MKKSWKCRLGWHDPEEIKLDIVIWNDKDAVANATIQCKKCGAFLTGISSKRVPIHISLRSVRK